MKDIVYTYGDKVYLNLTNKCSCNCEFCIRKNGDSVGNATSLWMGGDPTFDEIKSAIDSYDFGECKEIVFCGYGEPTFVLDNLIKTAEYLRENYDFTLRLNTNGQSDLINKKPTAKLLCENVDFISISLNSCDAAKYDAIVHSQFGPSAFDAVLEFASECRKYTENVMFSVVDVIPSEDIEECKKIAKRLDVPLRVREYTA